MISPYEDGKFAIRAIIITVFILTIVGYSLFQANKFITGPKIYINSPTDGETTATSSVDIAGQAKNIAFISLDDKPIFIDEQGNFSEKLLLYPGYNIIKMFAKDHFGRTTEKQIGVVYQQ